MEGRYNIRVADKDIPADNGVGVERHDHGVLIMPSSNAKSHLEGTTPPCVWNASCVSCSKGKRKCDGLRPCSRCIRRDGGLACTYQTRKIHKPHKP
ncbi:unnamed protein product, partial [Ascophyllum nodosum]